MTFSGIRIKQYKTANLIWGEIRRQTEQQVHDRVFDELRDQVERQGRGQVWEEIFWWIWGHK